MKLRHKVFTGRNNAKPGIDQFIPTSKITKVNHESKNNEITKVHVAIDNASVSMVHYPIKRCMFMTMVYYFRCILGMY